MPKARVAGAKSGLLADMAVAYDDELLAGQPFQSDRPAGVEFIGTDADFRA